MGIVFGLLVVGVVAVLLFLVFKYDDIAKYREKLSELRAVMGMLRGNKERVFFELIKKYHMDEKEKYFFEKEKEIIDSFNRRNSPPACCGGRRATQYVI